MGGFFTVINANVGEDERLTQEMKTHTKKCRNVQLNM